MSGSVSFSVSAGHVYQRKFANDELARALKGFHLYCVSRRPATRIDERSICPERGSTTLDAVILNPIDRGVRERFTLQIDWRIKSATFKSYADGSYFSVCSEEGEVLHGDAWALATSILGAPKGVADQEILYIGQAYGQRGERSAYDRTKEHGKVQRIYEEHSGEAWDIFISPLTIDETYCGSYDHIVDDEEGFDLEAIHALAGDGLRGGMAPKLSVDIVEHTLISAFQPPYNVKLVQWEPNNPTAAMRKIQAFRMRLLSVTMDGVDGMSRYYTSACPSRDRAHTFYFGLAAAPKRPHLNALDPGDFNYGMEIDIRAKRTLAERAEMSGVIMRWFGRSAPTLRKPPEVVFNQ
jgi:hypothetical protein